VSIGAYSARHQFGTWRCALFCPRRPCGEQTRDTRAGCPLRIELLLPATYHVFWRGRLGVLDHGRSHRWDYDHQSMP